MWYHDADPAVTHGKTEPSPCQHPTLGPSASRKSRTAGPSITIPSCSRGARSGWPEPSGSCRTCGGMAGAVHGAANPCQSSAGPMPCSVVNHAGSVRRARGGRKGRAPPGLAERRATVRFIRARADQGRLRAYPVGPPRVACGRIEWTARHPIAKPPGAIRSPVLIQRTKASVSRFFIADPFVRPRSG